MESNSKCGSNRDLSYQPLNGLLKRKRLSGSNTLSPQSPTQKVEYNEPPRKKISINDRLKLYREELTMSENSKLFRLHHISPEKYSPPNNKLQNINNRLENVKQSFNRQEECSTNVTYQNLSRSGVEQTIISKPLLSNLPNIPVDYKRKCIEYLQSSCAPIEMPADNDQSDQTAIFSSSSSRSFASSNSKKIEIDPEVNSCMDDEMHQEPCDNILPPVKNNINSYLTTGEENIINKNENNSDKDVDMDWAPFDEKIILSNIQCIRENMLPDILPRTELQISIQETSQELPHNSNVLKTLFIVVDTNIFVSHLEIVEEIMNIKINESPIIFLPWIVIQELDYIKDNKGNNEFLQKRAQIAVKFINGCLQDKNKLLQGQSIKDAIKQVAPQTNADDGILNCCLQIKDRKNRALLLSNDINLRNKALLSNVPAYGHDQIINILDPFRKKRSETGSIIVNKMKTHLSHLLSLIIVKEMKGAYGNVWNKMDGMSKAPWSIEECLERFLKYWGSVYAFTMPKNARQSCGDFRKFLKEKEVILNQDKFLQYSLSLCTYIRNGLPNYRESIDECIGQLKKLNTPL